MVDKWPHTRVKKSSDPAQLPQSTMAHMAAGVEGDDDLGRAGLRDRVHLSLRIDRWMSRKGRNGLAGRVIA